jgi:hypothetical protein
VPEHELLAKFVTKSSKASIHVLVKGKQGPNGFSNGFIDEGMKTCYDYNNTTMLS